MNDFIIKWQNKTLEWVELDVQGIISYPRNHAIDLFNRNVHRDDSGAIQGIPVVARDGKTYVTNFIEIFDKYKSSKKPVCMFSDLNRDERVLRVARLLD